MSAAVEGVDARVAQLQRIEQLRRRIAAVPARGEVPASVQPSFVQPSFAQDSFGTPPSEFPASDAKRVLPVPIPLTGLLPQGGLPRGSVVSMSGASSLLVGVLAAVTASGGHAAVIGHPRLGLLAAAEMGAELTRLAVVPDPGPDPVEVAAVLLDGLDLVVLGLGDRVVPPSRARAVVARARSKGATLLVTGSGWTGADIRLDATVRGYRGFGQRSERSGCGRVRGVVLAVGAEGRSFQRRTTRVELCPNRGRVEWTQEAVVPQPLPQQMREVVA